MSQLPERLGLPPFRQRLPWLGPDLQTLRDTLRASRPAQEPGTTIQIPLPGGEHLLARLELPRIQPPLALVAVLHGLGGCSDAEGPRRLARSLLRQGFAVLRLNLRGAGEGRPLARGTYAAACNADLHPALEHCRELAAALGRPGPPLPLAGAGISLGGTVLLNGLLEESPAAGFQPFDALVCISSPLDLQACAERFELPRNRVYQQWLVQRLIAQTLADPHGVTAEERGALNGAARPRTIRGFDAVITAPRWGHGSVDRYYAAASPLGKLLEVRPATPILVIHAHDDPWVPAAPAHRLAQELSGHGSPSGPGGTTLAPATEVLITPRGGHNGFHAPGDGSLGCWSDRLTARWLRRTLCG